MCEVMYMGTNHNNVVLFCMEIILIMGIFNI